MKLSLKQIVQVLISLIIAIGIFWYLYKDIKTESIKDALQNSSIFWISASVLISIGGYVLRAWRWKVLVVAGEHVHLKIQPVFWALMFGYLVNLVIPRAGEVARCAALRKSEDIPLGKLFGTVVLERTIDLFFMAFSILLAFIFQREVFLKLLAALISPERFSILISDYLPFVIAVVVVVGTVILFLVRQFWETGFLRRVRQFVRQFVRGLQTVSEVAHLWGFWLSSFGIWLIYFLMMYFVAIAMPSTAYLGPFSVLMVMVMGSIGMIAPVQGGIGTFHALVSFILLFYGLSEEEGRIFAVVVHATQVVTVVVLGTIGVIYLTKMTLIKKPQMD